MLMLKPSCECCDKDLPPDAADAMICTLECTFCRDCVETWLNGLCPNCGGNFCPRPIRPPAMLAKHPAATERTFMPYCSRYIGTFTPQRTSSRLPQSKLAQYQEVVLALSGIVEGRATPEGQRRYTDAANSMALIASPPVLKALRRFQAEISGDARGSPSGAGRE